MLNGSNSSRLTITLSHNVIKCKHLHVTVVFDVIHVNNQTVTCMHIRVLTSWCTHTYTQSMYTLKIQSTRFLFKLFNAQPNSQVFYHSLFRSVTWKPQRELWHSPFQSKWWGCSGKSMFQGEYFLQCVYFIYIINIHSTHTYIMYTKTFISDAINHD